MKLRHGPGALLLLALASASTGCDRSGPTVVLVDRAQDPALLGPFDHTHAAFDAILGRYVQDGRVDYAGLAADPAGLSTYLARLAAVSEEDAATWTREQHIAFWIDAYNAFTLRVVLEHLPIDSIRSIGLLPFAAFREPVSEFRSRGGARLSLEDIEKRVLLEELGEPRVHFAINCASASCPALLPRAWRAEDLDATLDSATRAFLADPTKNRWDPATRTLALSKIFDWYEADFVRAAGDVPTFVRRYAPPEMAAGIAAGDYTVVYLDYDWALNAR